MSSNAEKIKWNVCNFVDFFLSQPEINYLSPFCTSRFWECNSLLIICEMLACKRVTKEGFWNKIRNQHSQISEMGYQLRKLETPNDRPLNAFQDCSPCSMADTLFVLVRYAQPLCRKLTSNWLCFPNFNVIFKENWNLTELICLGRNPNGSFPWQQGDFNGSSIYFGFPFLSRMLLNDLDQFWTIRIIFEPSNKWKFLMNYRHFQF